MTNFQEFIAEHHKKNVPLTELFKLQKTSEKTELMKQLLETNAEDASGKQALLTMLGTIKCLFGTRLKEEKIYQECRKTIDVNRPDQEQEQIKNLTNVLFLGLLYLESPRKNSTDSISASNSSSNIASAAHTVSPTTTSGYDSEDSDAEVRDAFIHNLTNALTPDLSHRHQKLTGTRAPSVTPARKVNNH